MSELGALAEYWELRRSGLWPAAGAPAGAGRPVVLIGGFGITPRTMRPLARWLTGAGWIVQTAALGWNTGCGTTAVESVVETVSQLAGEHGPVTIVGHSRGGVLGRVAAVRAPELVGALITVCTPWAIGPPDRPGAATLTRVVRSARRHGLDLLASVDCADGPCCAAFREQMATLPTCPWSAIRSTADGIAGEEAQVTGPDREILIETTHLGGVLSVQGWNAIGQALT